MQNNLQDKVFGYPDVVRFSWRPVRDLLDDPEKAYKVTWEDEDEEDEGQASITDFLGSSSNGKRKRQRLGGSKLQKGFERPEGFF